MPKFFLVLGWLFELAVIPLYDWSLEGVAFALFGFVVGLLSCFTLSLLGEERQRRGR